MYTYDDSGNITKIADASGNTLRAYTYSRLTGRLLSEENAATGTKTTYQYGDYNGNLLSKTTTPLAGGTATTISYAYGNTTGWKDQLTAYNGDVITYDASGNPLTYRNGMTMTWQGGRELTTATNNGTSIAYSYNTNSIRTKKTVGGVATQYYLNGDTMVAEKKGSNLITYMFDETGERYGFLYNNTPYFYVRNMQGDVIRILNLFGSVLAQYEYDAWGKVLSVTDSDGDAITGATHIGNINPIRYRGYYYDTETGFYYLQSRYYDPEIGRFINADEPEMVEISANLLLAKGLFTYGENNPVMNEDPSGNYITSDKLLKKHNNWKLKNLLNGKIKVKYLYMKEAKSVKNVTIKELKKAFKNATISAKEINTSSAFKTEWNNSNDTVMLVDSHGSSNGLYTSKSTLVDQSSYKQLKFRSNLRYLILLGCSVAKNIKSSIATRLASKIGGVAIGSETTVITTHDNYTNPKTERFLIQGKFKIIKHNSKNRKITSASKRTSNDICLESFICSFIQHDFLCPGRYTF